MFKDKVVKKYWRWKCFISARQQIHGKTIYVYYHIARYKIVKNYKNNVEKY